MVFWTSTRLSESFAKFIKSVHVFQESMMTWKPRWGSWKVWDGSSHLVSSQKPHCVSSSPGDGQKASWEWISEHQEHSSKNMVDDPKCCPRKGGLRAETWYPSGFSAPWKGLEMSLGEIDSLTQWLRSGSWLWPHMSHVNSAKILQCPGPQF